MSTVQLVAALIGVLGILAVLVVIDRRTHPRAEQRREAYGADEGYAVELRWLRDQLDQEQARERLNCGVCWRLYNLTPAQLADPANEITGTIERCEKHAREWEASMRRLQANLENVGIIPRPDRTGWPW